MGILSKVISAFTARSLPRTVDGYRVYAVGDVHGRDDLLDLLITKIVSDMAARSPVQTAIVFLGDLIDRGPQSAEVVERLRSWAPLGARTIFLSGNHEEVLLRLLGGETGILADWLKFGGAECLASYGLNPARIKTLNEAQALAEIRATIPQAHQAFLASFADTFRCGDYLFVHAGIRPNVHLTAQAQSDLRWIRDAFLNDPTDHGFVVVHGHTISPKVDARPNRIGLDTGAYRTGVLSAMAVEGSERWFIDTAPMA